MMTAEELERFRQLLNERESSLMEWIAESSQAAQSDISKVRGLLSDLQHALHRIGDHTYGKCKVCHDEVELNRLEVQPAAEVCLGCISEDERRLLEEELFFASKIHRALLPQQIEAIEGYDLAVKAIAARSVGGDYFDVLRNDAGSRVKIFIADAMGKGIPAGMVMSNLQGALRVVSQEIDSPGRLVQRLNHWLCRNVPITKFVSLACLDLPIGASASSTLVAANAGHCPGIIIHQSGQPEFINPTGAVLGVHPDFEYGTCEHHLQSGDLVALYTDGVSEAENADGGQYGVERLIELLTSYRAEPLQDLSKRVLEDVNLFSGKSAPEDDLTLILLRKQ